MIKKLALLAIAALAAFARPAAAQEETVVALPANNLGFAPNYIAEQLGMWSNAGLKVKLVTIDGIGAMNAVLSKSADFSNSSGATILRANIRGQKVVSIANTFDGLVIEMVISKAAAQAAGITPDSPLKDRVAALKGRKVGMGTPNTILHGYLRYFAKKGGIDPERDFTLAVMQPEASVAALKNGSIDAFVQALPFPIIALHEGTGILLSSGLRGDKGEFPELMPMAFNGIVTRPDFCDQKPVVCSKLVAGYEQAMAYMHDHENEARETVRKRLPGMDPAVFDEAWTLSLKWTPRTGRMNDAGWANAQEIMIAGGMIKPEEKLSSFKDIYTNKFVK
jgi:NitT/TauT family transport system substrate-binding protein